MCLYLPFWRFFTTLCLEIPYTVSTVLEFAPNLPDSPLMSDSQYITIKPVQVLYWLLSAVFLLITLSLIGDFFRFRLGHGRVLGFVPEFNLDTENNIPTYFSGLLLLASATLLVVVARSSNDVVLPYRNHWLGLSGIFVYLSVDEISSLHERLIPPMRALFDAEGIFYFAWVIPAMVLLIAFALVYFRFWLQLPEEPRFYMGLAGTLYILGALGVEFVGGYLADAGIRGFTYSLATTIEEGLEMAGISVFIYSLLLLVSAYSPLIRILVTGEPSSSSVNR